MVHVYLPLKFDWIWFGACGKVEKKNYQCTTETPVILWWTIRPPSRKLHSVLLCWRPNNMSISLTCCNYIIIDVQFCAVHHLTFSKGLPQHMFSVVVKNEKRLKQFPRAILQSSSCFHSTVLQRSRCSQQHRPVVAVSWKALYVFLFCIYFTSRATGTKASSVLSDH